MKSRLIAGALLLSSALLPTTSFAQSAYWLFSYTGFYDEEATLFRPDARLDGSFTGIDANGDGALDLGELTSLHIGAVDYVACAASSNAYYHCGADSFRFSPDRTLSFNLGEYSSDPEGLVGGGHLITSGELDFSYNFSPYASSEHRMYWTDATVLSVVSVVPEAPAWAMLLAGTGGLGGVRLLRRRRSRPLHA